MLFAGFYLVKLSDALPAFTCATAMVAFQEFV